MIRDIMFGWLVGWLATYIPLADDTHNGYILFRDAH